MIYNTLMVFWCMSRSDKESWAPGRALARMVLCDSLGRPLRRVWLRAAGLLAVVADYGVEGHWAVAWGHLVVRGRGRDVTHVIDIIGDDNIIITYSLLVLLLGLNVTQS